MASLLGLYQQDAADGDPSLMRSVPGVAAWTSAATAYLTRLREEYDQMPGVSSRQKALAANCLDLASQALQTGASMAPDSVPPPAPPAPRPQPSRRGPFTTILLVAFALLLINLWILSIPGAFSLFVVMTVFATAYGPDMIASGAGAEPSPTERTRTTAQRRGIPLNTSLEPVIRRIDTIVSLEAPAPEPKLPPTLRNETLEFFQDILEAVIARDQDYAFKKISRTLEQVLLSEGIEIVMDVDRNASMFNIDSVADAMKAGITEAIRPALVKGSECLISGYAHHYVDA